MDNLERYEQDRLDEIDKTRRQVREWQHRALVGDPPVESERAILDAYRFLRDEQTKVRGGLAGWQLQVVDAAPGAAVTVEERRVAFKSASAAHDKALKHKAMWGGMSDAEHHSMIPRPVIAFAKLMARSAVSLIALGAFGEMAPAFLDGLSAQSLATLQAGAELAGTSGIFVGFMTASVGVTWGVERAGHFVAARADEVTTERARRARQVELEAAEALHTEFVRLTELDHTLDHVITSLEKTYSMVAAKQHEEVLAGRASESTAALDATRLAVLGQNVHIYAGLGQSAHLLTVGTVRPPGSDDLRFVIPRSERAKLDEFFETIAAENRPALPELRTAPTKSLASDGPGLSR